MPPSRKQLSRKRRPTQRGSGRRSTGSANRPETLIQIYAADGQPLLSHTQAARLRDYSVTPVQPDKRLSAREAALLPLATLSPSDYEQPNGILTADGKIVIDPSWSRIATYDASLPLVTHTRDDKVGAIDAAGRWAVPPSTRSWIRSTAAMPGPCPLTPTAATRPCY